MEESKPANHKGSPVDLAFFGGIPAFSKPLHVGCPNIGNREKFLERVSDIFERRVFSNNGPFVQEFETTIGAVLGVRHCIAVSSGTAALELLIRAIGLTGEVLIPSFTFVATAHALQWQGITPIFCDIDPDTHSLDVDKLDAMTTPQTSGIIGVHLWGEPCDIDGLSEFARRRDLALLFDASHAFGCAHNNGMIGQFGLGEVFSFHATKFVNSFEGGVITTNDSILAARLRLMRNFGFTGYDQVFGVGINAKMNEVSAAMGLCSLEAADEIIAHNRMNYERYRQRLMTAPGLSLFSVNLNQPRNYQYVVVEIDESVSGISRDLMLNILQAEGILARRYFYPGCHKLQPYSSLYPSAGLALSETETLCNRVLVLPTGQAMDENKIDRVCDLIQVVLKYSTTIQEMASCERG